MRGGGRVTGGPALTDIDLRELEQFIYREARFADEHDYDSWEALWTEDALYWVPVDGGRYDPERHVSIMYDNRRRISTRLQQLRTGKRYAQSPPSNLRRTISNVELLGVEGDDITVGANFVLYESKPRGIHTWAGRYTYVLRRVDGQLKLVRKTVVLVNSAEAVPSMGFLI
ncbi:aromatic-ring-hydroxylating dioxygenase subunit beta [Nocardia sp. NPDC052112]|uniref:aromatic-ring-hydroxylating dioxygenase subunit beta n=1 Tax=Nocardia sp. NPDC052112 TaxID=3155646 RepID=UPI00343B4C6E